MSSGKLTERDRQILTHLGRFGISYSEIIQHLFFGKVNPADVLQRLRGDDNKTPWCIESVPIGNGNRRGYRLTRKGAVLLGRGEKSGGSRSAFERPLILAFCCLSGTRRIPLEHKELEELFGIAPVPTGTHCLEMRARTTRLYNVYVPGPETNVQKVVQTAKAKRDQLIEEEAYHAWVSGHLYSVAIVVQEEERADRIRQSLLKTKDARGVPITLNDGVIVERVPAIGRTLEEALDALATVSKTSSD